jgi:hypothetical protein
VVESSDIHEIPCCRHELSSLAIVVIDEVEDDDDDDDDEEEKEEEEEEDEDDPAEEELKMSGDGHLEEAEDLPPLCPS